MKPSMISLFFLLGCQQASVGVEASDRRLTASPVLLDFGAVAGDAIATREVVLASTSGDAVRVHAAAVIPTAGGDFVVDAEAGFSVERNGQLRVPVQFLSAQSGFHAARLEFETDGDPAVLSVELRAYTGTPSLDFLPSLLDFGEVNPGSTRTVALRLDNDGAVPVLIESATFSGPFAAATALPFTATAGVISEFDLTFQPTTAEAVEGTVVFGTPNGPTQPVALRGNACTLGDPAAYDLDRDGVTTCGGDCDDSRALAYPGAFELPNGADDDCDGFVDDGTPLGDDDGDGFSESEGDCDDFAPVVYPAAPELPDGVDNDCDGDLDEGTTRGDDDRDGYTEEGGDCNDADPAIGPKAYEVPGNGTDEDCNPATL
jgi:hypothetical protein